LLDEAFHSAIVPLARLVAEHLTRDLFAKRLGWPEFEFISNDLDATDAMQEVEMQTALLAAGVLTVNEVRAMRGLAPLPDAGADRAIKKEEHVTTSITNQEIQA
jgi:hypothetical protein